MNRRRNRPASAGRTEKHRPRRRFGQNFLHDPAVIARIVAAVAPLPEQHLVEIGPGLGALTGALLERAGRLDTIEIDRDLAASLQRRFGADPRFGLHVGDAMKAGLAALRSGNEKLRIVGNLPYNVSTPLLFRLLDQLDVIDDMTFMLQKEVVDRMAARPGGKTYGRLTVMLAARCRVEPLFNVGPGAFRPAPRVRSAVVRLQPHPEPPFSIDDDHAFARIVATAFSMRRKTLRRSLAKLLPVAAIEAAGVDPALRPERLEPADFARLANRLAAAPGGANDIYSG